jgi:ribonuclease P protein component
LRARVLAAEVAGSEDRGRLGLVVSKQVGNAVVRNRVKRRVREWFRIHRWELPAQTDLVVVARSGAGGIPTRELWAELMALASQASR